MTLSSHFSLPSSTSIATSVAVNAFEHDPIGNTVSEARPGMSIPLSISAGSAVFPHDGDSYESLLAKADSRMYRDKVARKSESQTLSAEHGSSTVPPDTRAKAG